MQVQAILLAYSLNNQDDLEGGMTGSWNGIILDMDKKEMKRRLSSQKFTHTLRGVGLLSRRIL
jgi:hypothetical protein